MRYLVQISMPNEPFNSRVREGTAAQTLGRIIEETKPEAIYFSEYDGKRCAIAIYEAIDEGLDFLLGEDPGVLDNLIRFVDCRVRSFQVFPELGLLLDDDVYRQFCHQKRVGGCANIRE